MLSNLDREASLLLLKRFKIDGQPANEVVTEGQLLIFHEIVFQRHPRVQIICSTQYGKSLMVAIACIVSSCLDGRMIAVIAPRDKQAKIIMRYYIEHLGDDEAFYAQLEKNTKLERLRMEESKDRIILRNGGGIFALSVNAGMQKGLEAAMGSGAQLVITDESSLIGDSAESGIFRMIAGKKDAFYCKIGNPFYRNHFLKSWLNPEYHKIFIDYEQGIEEGRYNEIFINEARTKPLFDILYGCKFPPEDSMDIEGYTSLLTEEEVKSAQLGVESIQPFGEKRLGADIAEGGGDSNALVLRHANLAEVIKKFQADNTMATTGQVVYQMKELGVFDQNVFIDSLGVGKGLYDRMVEQNYKPHSVRFSESASDKTQFANLRAECYWRLREWIKSGGKLRPNPDWMMLSAIKYRVMDSSGAIILMSKDDLRKEGFASPDVCDALAITFARKVVINQSREERKEERETLKQFDARKKKSPYLTGSRYLRQ